MSNRELFEIMPFEAHGVDEVVSYLLDFEDAVPTVTYDPTVAINKLLDAYNEACGMRGCGDEGGHITPEVLDVAGRFLLSIPLGTPLPEPDPGPDNSMAFIWYGGPAKRLTVDINAKAELAWAARIGTYRVRGSKIFTGSVPSDVLSLVPRVLF